MMSFYYKYLMLIIYCLVSMYLFVNVYKTSKMIIDEEFHLRQGLHYCDGNFTIWDPKITTFPGLYIASTVLFLPFRFCNVFTLRLTSLLASVVNVWFIYEIRKLAMGRKRAHDFKVSLDTLTISLLPPMYFFAHLYYTDILSITTILGLLLHHMKHEHNKAAIYGLASVIMRQTNIVWVGFALCLTIIDKLVFQTIPFIRENKDTETKGKIDHSYSFKDILDVIVFYCKRIYLIPKQLRLLAVYLIGYISVIVLFLMFLLINGSIVVGDKSSHQASIHLPQLMYFSLFSAVFGISIILTTLSNTIRCIIRRWYLIVPAFAVFAGIVYLNTLVHPYLLADNRHITFAIWNKFYGRYVWAKYATIPIYLFAMVAIDHALQVKTAGFKLMFTVCLLAAVALQKLLELRYFLIPFLIIRLNIGELKYKYLILEFLSHCLVNLIAFNIFFTIDVYWEDYSDAQRIIW